MTLIPFKETNTKKTAYFFLERIIPRPEIGRGLCYFDRVFFLNALKLHLYTITDTHRKKREQEIFPGEGTTGTKGRP